MDKEQLAALEAQMAAEVARLPCVGKEGLEAVNACSGTDAWRTCPIYGRGASQWLAGPKFCERKGAEDSFWRRKMALDSAGPPMRARKVVMAGILGRTEDAHGFTPWLPMVPLVDTDALRFCKAYVSRKPATVEVGDTEVRLAGNEWCLCLAGGPGTGKTIAATWALARNGGCYLAAGILGRIDDQPIRENHTVGDAIDDAKRTGLLVLDDVGTEHEGATGWATGRIADLLCARYDADKPTIVTTNLRRRGADGSPGFAERYGARVDDRLREGGLFVALADSSMRGR